MSRPAGRVLLLSPPLRGVDEADIGLATLLAILRREGICTDALYGTPLFPRTATEQTVLWLYSTLYFAPYLNPALSPAACADAILARYRDEANLEGLRLPPEEATLEALGIDGQRLRRDILADIGRAGRCLDRCLDRATARRYDVIGISCTFENQLAAGLALAGRLRRLQPEAWILLGGATCFGPAAAALVQACPAVDAVCGTEGDQIIIPLVRGLLEHGSPPADAAARAELRDRVLAGIPGLAWLGADGRCRRTAAPPLLRDLDQLPDPDYADFVAQLAASPWRDRPPRLYFETSRGCWWGQKHLCSFCGLNAEGLEYRRKSPERAVREIRSLQRRYPMVKRLHCADNILDMDYLRTVLPRLREMEPGRQRPRLFWEIKSNLRPEQVQVLADAGVDLVQPGIESFSDEILQLMKKGSSALGQVQIIKHLHERGIKAIYSIILRTPNERAQHYRRMSELVPFIEHLPPPQLGTMCLMRFSPYFVAPGQHGIRDVRPRPYYRLLFPSPAVDLDRLAYHFDYDHAMFSDQDLLAAQREFVRKVIAWNERWQPDLLYYLDDGETLLLVDRRGGAVRLDRLSGTARALYRYLDRTRSRAALQRRFRELDPGLLASLIDAWLRRRWICQDTRQRLLAVAPRKDTKSPAFVSRERSDPWTTAAGGCC